MDLISGGEDYGAAPLMTWQRHSQHFVSTRFLLGARRSATQMDCKLSSERDSRGADGGVKTPGGTQKSGQNVIVQHNVRLLGAKCQEQSGAKREERRRPFLKFSKEKHNHLLAMSDLNYFQRPASIKKGN